MCQVAPGVEITEGVDRDLRPLLEALLTCISWCNVTLRPASNSILKVLLPLGCCQCHCPRVPAGCRIIPQKLTGKTAIKVCRRHTRYRENSPHVAGWGNRSVSPTWGDAPAATLPGSSMQQPRGKRQEWNFSFCSTFTEPMEISCIMRR